MTALPRPFRWEGGHIAIDLRGGAALFTTRRGGVSEGPYASLNLGPWTDDDPGHVAENRGRAAAVAGVTGERLAQGHQVHGTAVARLSEAPEPGAEPADRDGQAVSAPDVGAIVLVADCLPVAIAGDGAVAAVHCGWRGLAGGIVAEAVAALRELGATGPLEAATSSSTAPSTCRPRSSARSSRRASSSSARTARRTSSSAASASATT